MLPRHLRHLLAHLHLDACTGRARTAAGTRRWHTAGRAWPPGICWWQWRLLSACAQLGPIPGRAAPRGGRTFPQQLLQVDVELLCGGRLELHVYRLQGAAEAAAHVGLDRPGQLPQPPVDGDKQLPARGRAERRTGVGGGGRGLRMAQHSMA